MGDFRKSNKHEAIISMRAELHNGDTRWVKASRSNTQGNQCVEAAFLKDGVAVRDSKDPQGPELLFTRSEWEAFMHGAKQGEFDLDMAA